MCHAMQHRLVQINYTQLTTQTEHGVKPDSHLSAADRSDSPLKTVLGFPTSRWQLLIGGGGGWWGETSGLQCLWVVGRPPDYNAMLCWRPARPLATQTPDAHRGVLI